MILIKIKNGYFLNLMSSNYYSCARNRLIFGRFVYHNI